MPITALPFDSYSHNQLLFLLYDRNRPLYDSLPLSTSDLRACFNDSPFGTIKSPSYFYITRNSDAAANSDDFFMEFCGLISDALGLPDKVDEFWESKRRSNPIKCSRYMTEYILRTLRKPLILALDEVERLFTCPFRNDFFGMLRAWHNDKPNMGNLTILLSGSTEPSLFVTNNHQSPFNVAERINLQDFTLEQVQTLNKRYGEILTPAQTQALYELLGGQPFLTRLVWYKVALGQINAADLLANPLDDDSPFNDHLSRYWQVLLDLPELKPALSQICRQQTHAEDKTYFRLIGSGLIKKQGKQVTMRNELYRRYFEERL